MDLSYFKKSLADSLYNAMPEAGLSLPEVLSLIEIPPEQRLGDFAFPCFKLAKALKKAPPVIAADMATRVQAPKGFRVTATGPYINFFLDYSSVTPDLFKAVADSSLFRPQSEQKLPRTMIEFSQPNTHKAFHVGHCRNVALGDALVRMNRYMGYDVVAANYIGDEGAHIAKCLWYYTKYASDQKPVGDKGEWLGGLYSAATMKLEDASEDEKKIYQKEISEILKKMELREPVISKIWDETKKWSMDSFYGVYDWLGVKFDHYFFESEVTDAAKEIVDDGLKRGVFSISDGAVGIDFNDIGLGFAMVRKSDGTLLYSTRDLALARKKFKDFNVERSIYVVASEQELHFKQVFKMLERLGFKQVANCYHLSYGLVMIPEGKMSSRKGTVIYFSSLKDKILTQIKEVAFKEIDTSDWSPQEIEDTARKIAVAAIRYGMIASDPKKTIVFDMDKWLSFTGDTGPYLLYTYVRMKAILRKAGFNPAHAVNYDTTIFNGDSEKSLVKRVMSLNEAVQRSVLDNSPVPLAGYLFDFCQDFNSFYAHTSILKQEDPRKKNAYLHLISATAEVLKAGCALLGIEMPERM
jgi:arginyl-tRNA synthetase